jgi:NifU-like protein involved in Fe-S cluster formation
MAQIHYNEQVRRRFASPLHAGSAEGWQAAASRGAATVVLSADVAADRVVKSRFRVLGCPHLVAASELICEEIEGRRVADLRQLQLRDILDRLEIPVEKTGLILLLEDAIEALLRNMTAQSAKESK